MDPVSHVIFGRTLIALDRRQRLGGAAAAAAALGALAPDVDALAAFSGWDVYLRVHAIGTHSIAGSVAVAVATGIFVHQLKRGSRCPGLILAAAVGTLSHVAFDLVSGASMALGWPLVPGRASLPLVAMADPWIIAICAAAAVAFWVLRRRVFELAVTTLAAISIFLALKCVLMAAAVPRWRAATSTDLVVDHLVQASWSSLTRWDVFDRTPEVLRKWRVDALGTAALSYSIPLRADSALVEASRSFDTVQNFLSVHDLGFAVTTPVEDGALVLWSDIRYCRSPTQCGLWFGGAFDPDGRPIRQIVRVGDWQQIRAVER